MTTPKPGWRARLGAALTMLMAGRTAVAGTDTAIAIAAPQSCPPELRERIAEQIVDVADDISWSCVSRLDEEEPFRGRATGRDLLRFWIDLTPGTEARLTLHDGRSDRFVVRRLPLPRGLDEIGREEIGQIVRSALLAVRASPDETMTRDEARAEVAHWPQPRATTAPRAASRPSPAPERPAAPSRPLTLDIAAIGSARVLASQVPVVGEIGVSVDIGRWGPVGGWIEGADQLAAQYDGSPVGATLRALAMRAGLEASWRLGHRWRARLGVGAGLTRAAFSPRADGATATAAPAGAFTYATGRGLAGVEARLGAHVLTGVTLFVDRVGADVHYDLRDPDGTMRRVLTPYRFQPGIALRIGWSVVP